MKPIYNRAMHIVSIVFIVGGNFCLLIVFGLLESKRLLQDDDAPNTEEVLVAADDLVARFHMNK